MSRRAFGALLAQLRRQRGFSQQRLAELLCRASGAATVSRHEISRWERGERLPGPLWLSWLAVVLDAPVARLTSAVRACRPPEPDADPVDEVLTLAAEWSRTQDGRPGTDPQWPPDPRLHQLRRMDDLVGGVDLSASVRHDLSTALSRLDPHRRPPQRLCEAAQLAQLCGWSAADAGDQAAALRSYADGLSLAMEAGDHLFTAHLLGCASHALARHRPAAARRLAALALAGVRRHGTAGLRAVLAHRLALAAAYDGATAAGQEALLVARRLGERLSPAAEPGWLYWLDDTQLAWMTGRCLVVLGRPLRALPLLMRPSDGTCGPRDLALNHNWLARALLEVGELEQSCAAGTTALIETIRSGSARATALSRDLAVRMAARRGPRAVRELGDLFEQLVPYLPAPASRPFD